MNVQIVEPEAQSWDQFVAESGGHVLQTSAWGALKRAFGWRDQIVAVTDDGGAIGAGATARPRG